MVNDHIATCFALRRNASPRQRALMSNPVHDVDRLTEHDNSTRRIHRPVTPPIRRNTQTEHPARPPRRSRRTQRRHTRRGAGARYRGAGGRIGDAGQQPWCQALGRPHPTRGRRPDAGAQRRIAGHRRSFSRIGCGDGTVIVGTPVCSRRCDLFGGFAPPRRITSGRSDHSHEGRSC